MKVVAIVGKQQCELIERPEPVCAENFVKVKVHSAPMCTEYKFFEDGVVSDCLGHEAAGEVVEVAQECKVKVGDRVAVMPLYPCGKCALCLRGDYIHCQNTVDPLTVCSSKTGVATYAQYLLKQDWLLMKLPDEVSYDHGAMACCGLGPTFGAMQRMAVDAFDTVLITGMGPVGLGGVINGTFRGACVFVVEGNPYRRNLALELGAAEAFDPADGDTLKKIMALTGGLGVDKALDCSGVSAAQRLMVDAVRRRGQVAFVGEGGEFAIHVSDDMIRKGLSMHGSWHYNLGGWPRILDVIKSSGEKLDKVITHSFPMSDVAAAWAQQLTGQSGKVMLHPWG